LEDHEQELIRHDGTHIWVSDSSRIVSDSDGAVLYYEGAMVDVTQRKQAEDTTRRLIRILEATPDFVAIADEQGYFQYANQAARSFAGIPIGGDIRGLRVREVLAIEEAETIADILRSEVWSGILALRRPDGSHTPASTVVINHRDKQGNIEYFSAVARDISERIAAEARLEQLVRSKDDFVASVSHELRTPLTAVVGLTQELRDGWDRFTTEETTEFVSLIADQSAEVANIVEDLLVAARADIGKIAISKKETHVGRQISAVLAALGMNDSTSIIVRCGEDDRALADATRVRQIIRNLLTNAFRYGGDQIELSVHRNDGSVLVTVTDDGPGVPVERRESIFEPYERAHTVSTQPASVGLGLTVSRQLARLMGGDLTYAAGSSGSSFELSLPAYD
ncbi:MAG: PAS domain-containing sensor histidine kinase, partial [Acidimicrobiia bacterium]|nr:PAS domain-containing sensor histidine kinase [Acidimicrobiia bacterium]